MENTTGSRKMLNRHRFRPHVVNSRIISTSQQPALHHLETNSPQLFGLKVKIFNSSALSPQTEHVGGETKESVLSRLDLGGGDAELCPKDPQYFRYVDEGYFTLSTTNSSPAPGSGYVLVDECYPESPPELHQEVKCEPRFSFAQDLSSLSGLPSEPVNIAECFDEDGEGVWNIGHPIFESSTFVILNENTERSEVESGEAQKESTEESLSSPSADSGLSTSWESTILPHVQVQSKVVVPNLDTLQPKPAASVDPSPRSINFNEAHWKQKKDQYVNLVSRHMCENPRADHDVMSDLVDLMSRVDKQSAGSHSANWQHPSDLTRRNYRARFGNGDAKMSLQEWQDKNGKNQKRFANVLKIFKRSPCL